jgi:hypothetical protein
MRKVSFVHLLEEHNLELSAARAMKDKIVNNEVADLVVADRSIAIKLVASAIELGVKAELVE